MLYHALRRVEVVKSVVLRRVKVANVERLPKQAGC